MEKQPKARQRIVTLAREKFATIGYSHVSIADFAAELRMSKATFYKYFSSKEELLYAVIDEFYDEFAAEVDRLLSDPALGLTDKIRQFMLRTKQRFAQVRVSAVDDFRRAVPEAYALLEQKRKAIVTGKLVRLFEEGARTGDFRQDIPPETMAHVLLTALQSMEAPEYMQTTSYPFQDMFGFVFSLILEGTLSEQGRNRLEGGEAE